MQSFDPKDRERFRKIVGVMEGATIEGERAAARQAAERLAALNGMTLDEAILDAHPERDDGRIDAEERRARRRDFEAWAARQTRMNAAYERAEKERFEEAKREAVRRGYRPEEEPRPRRARAAYRARYAPSGYKPTAEDRFRLIAGLLRDGVSLRRAADLADAPANEVARIWLLIR
ncbi:MAG: hypothetical protein NXI21_09135 [Alphaproteobacteria bacterium]|nr:hypothetical protein [Alphaproteobacteria bacterium]